MIVTFTLPRLGETMESGRVATWLKQPGDRFKRGETLVEIESDKTVVEMPALADGVLHEIVVAAGEDADVGAVLCRYDDGKADTASADPAPQPATPPVTEQPATPTPAAQGPAMEPAAERPATKSPATQTAPSDISSNGDQTPPAKTLDRAAFDPGDEVREDRGASLARPAGPAPADRAPPASTSLRRATPLARAIARSGGVSLDGLAGSGRRGRIEAADVRAMLERTAPTSPATAGAANASGAHVERRDWSPANARSPVVLLHGLAADVQSWASLASALSRAGRRVTAFDLPGHGGTAVEATDLDGAVAAIAPCLDQLGDEPVELVGHSVGGAIAVRLARRHPDRIARLTLLAPAGLDRAIDVEFIRGIAGVRSAGALPHLLRRLAVRPQPMSAAQLEALAHELGRGRLGRFADTLVDDVGQQIDITADLRALAMPVRVVWGLQDRIIPWTQVKEVGSRCAVHLIPDAGHVPHWDQPAEVAALFD